MEAAKHFNIPVYVSEQYPKGLGHTTKDIKIDDAALVFEKTKFSMYTPELEERLKKDIPNLGSVVLFGIEVNFSFKVILLHFFVILILLLKLHSLLFPCKKNLKVIVFIYIFYCCRFDSHSES